MRKASVVLEKPLTKVQQKAIDAVMEGKKTSIRGSAGKSEKVQHALAAARTQMRDISTITRIDVLNGIMEGIDMAKLNAEPATIVKGWVEISKILGYDQPEQKRKVLSTNANMLQDRLLHMSTADLLELAAGNMAPIEGEALRVED
jgi:hypothetical protein